MTCGGMQMHAKRISITSPRSPLLLDVSPAAIFLIGHVFATGVVGGKAKVAGAFREIPTEAEVLESRTISTNTVHVTTSRDKPPKSTPSCLRANLMVDAPQTDLDEDQLQYCNQRDDGPQDLRAIHLGERVDVELQPDLPQGSSQPANPVERVERIHSFSSVFCWDTNIHSRVLISQQNQETF